MNPADAPARDVAAAGTGAVPLTGTPDRGGHGGASTETAGHAPEVGYAPAGRRRRTSLAARGEPMVWLTGGAAALGILMIAGLLLLVAVYGFGTFWPVAVSRVTFQPGGADAPRTLLGERFRDDAFTYNEDQNFNDRLDDGEDYDGDGELDTDLRVEQALWSTGNKDVAPTFFTFVNEPDVVKIEEPEWALTIERDEWGRAFGTIEAVSIDGELIEGPAEAWAAFRANFDAVRRIGRDLRDVKGEIGDLGETKKEIADKEKAAREIEADDPEAAAALRAEAEATRGELTAKETELNAEVARLRREQGKYRIFVRTEQGEVLPAERTRKTFAVTPRAVLDADAAERVSAVRVAGTGLRPATAGDAPMGLASRFEEDIAAGARVVTAGSDARAEFLDAAGEVVGTYDLAPRALVVVADAAEVSAGTPVAHEPLPMTIGGVVRAYPANQLGLLDKLGVYGSRWWEFLSDEPREANMEGGVLPQIVGTVLLTFIMVVFALPIGVVAAIYLREYAKQGPLTSLVRISVNNLAGVPSIVYGVFGLGFFAYGVGGWIDGGAEGAGATPLPVSNWLLAILAAVAVGGVAVAATLFAGRSERGAASDDTAFPKVLRLVAGLAWATAAATTFYFVFASIPAGVFDGFNTEAARAGQPVWKGGALIWASMTLALLTLPVVIVATEEALAAVPRSMREGSYACGASKWQTIWRIVLPRALPGIMTGAILAISRGAGEVAPIMLVGALKIAEAPIGGSFPFVEFDQSFAHLGFHIFDLGFQSPDAEAARSMVYTTTLLLIGIVLVLNLTAIFVRSRLRRAFAGGAF